MINITVTCNGIAEKPQIQQSHRTCGFAGLEVSQQLEVENSILKEAAQEMAPILTLIFQRSLDAGIVPEEWRNAWIVRIYKKGDKY